jgi:hypothetical protein
MDYLKWTAIILVLICQPIDAAELADPREPLFATAIERAYILEQMRLFVASIQMVAEGLATGNANAIVETAAARGQRQAASDPNFPATLSPKLTPFWKQMGAGVRGGFDALAAAARDGEPKEKTLGLLAETMRNCVACHQTYKIVETDP